jgi:hypothetical protein
VVKRHSAVVYVDNNKILFYVKDTKNNLQLDLPADVISDLEVVGRDNFDELIDTFFQTDSLKNIEFDVILVFSQEVTFEKDFADDATKVKYEEIQKFLDMVPFEDVLSNTYKINKKTKVVAVNKVLYDVLHVAFERNKAFIFLVVPMSVLAEINPESANNLDLSAIAARADSIKQYGLIDVNEDKLELEQKNLIGIKKKDIRLSALLGIFALLLVILLILIYTTFLSPPKTNKKPVVLPRTSITPAVTNKTNPLPSKAGEISSPSSLLESTPSSKF